MNLNIKSSTTIQSEDLLSKIRNSPISYPSYFGSFDPQSLFTDASQNFTPFCSVSTPSIVNERIDDIPLLVAILLKLDLPNIIDKFYTPHANHEGLSHGWLLTVWMVYILSQGDHRMSSVQDWVASRCSVLAVNGSGNYG